MMVRKVLTYFDCVWILALHFSEEKMLLCGGAKFSFSYQ